MNKFKFVENMKDGKFTQEIYLNDKKLDGVRSFKYISCVGEISRVLLEIYPSEIEIESDVYKLTTEDFTIDDMFDALAQRVGEGVVKSNINIKSGKKENKVNFGDTEEKFI